MKAFQIKKGSKTLDYRVGQSLDLKQVKQFFAKKCQVKNLWQSGRHVLGVLEINKTTYFLKLATTEGIGEVTKIEFEWNDAFNKASDSKVNFCVPKNIECGVYDNLFYMITEKFEGKLLAERPEKLENPNLLFENIDLVLNFSEYIQTLNIKNLSYKDNHNYIDTFIEKTKLWAESISEETRNKYSVNHLLKMVEKDAKNLERKTRHGDFTPWHIIKLNNGDLGLIDGEHAMANGVEYYDIGYFIQRIFNVLENEDLAKKVYALLEKKNYNLKKLKIILIARAIGGFLDESLKPNPNYSNCKKFSEWIIKI